jgi:hypothetical protein
MAGVVIRYRSAGRYSGSLAQITEVVLRWLRDNPASRNAAASEDQEHVPCSINVPLRNFCQVLLLQAAALQVGVLAN